jgi:hypothetical protein
MSNTKLSEASDIFLGAFHSEVSPVAISSVHLSTWLIIYVSADWITGSEIEDVSTRRLLACFVLSIHANVFISCESLGQIPYCLALRTLVLVLYTVRALMLIIITVACFTTYVR